MALNAWCLKWLMCSAIFCRSCSLAFALATRILAKAIIPKAESKSKTEKTPKETKQKEENKLSYSEKKEYNNLENLIEKLEKKKQKLEEQFASGEIQGEEINQASIELQKIIEEIEEKELRWLELSEKA